MSPSPANSRDAFPATDGIHQLPVLSDNVIWIWVRGRQAVVVDPAVAEPVIAWLEARELELEAVLQTHHHADHIGGTPALLRHWPKATVVAAASDRERIPFQTLSVEGGDRIPLLGEQIQVIDVPAHTRAHIAFVLPGDEHQNRDPALFCGDTLFSGGCGRLFEGSAADMHLALQRLAALPEQTTVHCAHEYTEANLKFALTVEPGNQALLERSKEILALRKDGKPTVPSTIGEEKATNPFLRPESENLQSTIGKAGSTLVDVFAETRRLKDNF